MENESYYTNSPSLSPMTVTCATYGNRSYYLRVAFISLRASDCAATIWRQRLFEEIR